MVSRHRAVLLFIAGSVIISAIAFIGRFFVVPLEASRHEVEMAMLPLVNGVNEYRNRNRVFPRSLNDLVPSVLSRLPDVPRGGKCWDYECFGSQDEHFRVTLRLRREAISYQTDVPGHWFFSDSDL